MLSKILIQSAAVALFAAVVDSQAVPSGEPFFDASDIEDVVPSQYLAPAEATSIAAVADSFIASVTAAPEYSSVFSVLATGIPVTARLAIENDPTDFVLGLLQGSPPSWATALPPSVEQYLESIARDAAKIVTSDFAGLYTSVSSEVAALETGAAVSGGFVAPTGGYGKSNFTAPRPTGSAAAPGSTPLPFQPSPGAASSLQIGRIFATVVAAGLGVGAWLMF
ncbi:MAG: hypothetical protein LQ338_003735 [Usnochroma carphineum]|nr:MAG: hypothetical protein LQ338_003735 [Usnochroma carphineum]